MEWFQHDYAKVVLILSVALALSFLISILMTRTLKRWADKTETEIDDYLVSFFRVPLLISILSGGLWQALAIYEGTLPKQFLSLAHSFMLTLTILIWGMAFMGFAVRLLEYYSKIPHRFRAIQPRSLPLFRMTAKTIVALLALYFVTVAWGQNVSGLLTSAGVVGIAVGFAARDTLANFISGIFILADAPYKIGDFVVLGNGERGRVTDIGIRSTRLLTRDDVEIIIPNAIIGNTEIMNQSGGPHEKFRLKVPIGVAYGSDIDQVKEILIDIAVNSNIFEKDPTPRVRLRAHGASSLDFELMAWLPNPEMTVEGMDYVLTEAYKIFGQKGIEIPYPKRDVYLHQVEKEDTE